MAARKSAPKDFNTYIGDNGRVNRCAELIKQGKLKTGGILLDVGGAIGDLGHAVRDLYDKTIIVDISEQNLVAARSKGNFTMHGDCDLIGFKRAILSPDEIFEEQPKDDSISMITALDFIEHIVDPENFARECFRVLESGGEVFVNTPNIQYWEHLESQLRGKFPHTSGDREVYHGGHLAFYNYNDMFDIFVRSAGFNFESATQIRDEEGYRQPPQFFIDKLAPQNQFEYEVACELLGNPNLLFKCVKP